MAKSPTLLASLGLFASFFALGVIALGAFTRLIDAGLGCPDWPGCYGQLIIPFAKASQQIINLKFPTSPLIAYKAWAEMIHRYFVGGLSILIMAIVATIFSKKQNRSRANMSLACVLVLLLAYQILLGQLTVTLKLLPVVVSQHLLGGFLILSSLWSIYLVNSQQRVICSEDNELRKFLPWAFLAVIMLLLQISLGAWTSTNYASLSCPDFPFCVNDQTMAWNFKEAFNIFSPTGINYEGGVLAEATRQTIQMTHRLGALVLTLYLFLLMMVAAMKLKNIPAITNSCYVVLGLLCIQLCIGITNVIFKLPLITAILHNLVAALLLLAVITFTFKLATNYRRVSS